MPADYDVTVTLTSYSATTSSLGAFFAIQSISNGVAGFGPHGFRYSADSGTGGEELVSDLWYGTSPAQEYRTGYVSGAIPATFHLYRVGVDTYVDVSGAAGETGSFADPAATDRVVGFGIANIAPAPAAVSGQVTARFSGFALVDSAGGCFATGLD